MSVSNMVQFLYFTTFLFGLALFLIGLILWILLRRTRTGGILLVISIIVTIGSIIGLIVIGNAVYLGGSQTCIFCHEMRPEYKKWKASEHGNIECLACHMPVGGVVTFIVEDIKTLGEVYAHFTGDYPKTINKNSELSKEMKSNVCERCHKMDVDADNRAKTKIKIDHEDHLELGIMTCTDCHNRITHLGARDFPYFNGMKMMEGCMRCHMPGNEREIDGKTAPSECSVCHRDKDLAEKTFGTTDVDASDFFECRACHGLSDPKLVADYDATEMAQEDVDCIDCHGEHDDDFIPRPTAKVCLKCHKDAADEVIDGDMGFDDFDQPFKKAKDVECDLCHKPHSFEDKRPKS